MANDFATFMRLAAARIEANGGVVPDDLMRAVAAPVDEDQPRELPPLRNAKKKATSTSSHIQKIIQKKFYVMTPEILAEGNRLQGVLNTLSSSRTYLTTRTPDKNAIEILSMLHYAFESLATVDDAPAAASFQTLAEGIVTNTIAAIDAAIASVQSDFDSLSTPQQ